MNSIRQNKFNFRKNMISTINQTTIDIILLKSIWTKRTITYKSLDFQSWKQEYFTRLFKFCCDQHNKVFSWFLVLNFKKIWGKRKRDWLLEFKGIPTRLQLFDAAKRGTVFIVHLYLYFFCYCFPRDFCYTVIYEIFLSNTNNLYRVAWFQVYLSNTNNLYLVVWFQVFLSNTNYLNIVVWFQVFLSNTNYLNIVVWFQVFLSNTNNLYIVVWFQVFLSNTNNLYIVVWFQVFLSNTNNVYIVVWFHVFLYNTNNLYIVVWLQVFLSNTNNLYLVV